MSGLSGNVSLSGVHRGKGLAWAAAGTGQLDTEGPLRPVGENFRPATVRKAGNQVWGPGEPRVGGQSVQMRRGRQGHVRGRVRGLYREGVTAQWPIGERAKGGFQTGETEA